MYSRYTPKPGGGYERRLVPEPPKPRPETPVGAAIGRPPEAAGSRPQATGAGSPGPRPSVGAGVPDGPHIPVGAAHPGPRPAAPRPLPRPPAPGMGPPPMGPPGGLLGHNGLLGRLLPRGLDTEDLLVLAVLLLAMKQDGAAGTELLMAAILYLWLQ